MGIKSNDINSWLICDMALLLAEFLRESICPGAYGKGKIIIYLELILCYILC